MQAVPGNGLTGVCNGKFLAGGNRAFIEKKTAGGSKEAEELYRQSEELANQGKTPLYFCADGKLLGVIAVADVIKEDSPRAVT